MNVRPLGRRYAPVVALLAVQALLVVIAPSRGGSGDRRAGALVGDERFAGPGASGDLGAGGLRGSVGGDGAASAGMAGSKAGTARGGRASAAAAAAAAGARGYVSTDLGKCAPGGVVQQKVTRQSPRCVGRWVGDNGGATSKGVTRDEIRVVYVRFDAGPFFSDLLVGAGLASTPEQDRETLDAFGAFFEKHYEFYGRKIRWILHQNSCVANDPNYAGCLRQEARTIDKKYQPFYVFWFTNVLEEFYDELSRLGIVNTGGFHLTQAFNEAHRPFHWDLYADGDRLMRNVADYWCKKMYGRNASRAGDPILQTQKRKMGIMTLQQPLSYVKNAELLVRLVTGGMCGTAADKPALIQYSGDVAQANQQMTAAVQAFEEANVTSVVCMCDPLTPIFMTQAMDQQHYFPEHLIAGSASIDVDFFGRVYSPTQWRNAFGPSFLYQGVSTSDVDGTRAWRDAGKSGEPCTVCHGIWLYMELAAIQLQWAGPYPTPESLERGSQAAPPIGGWDATGHDPSVLMFKFGPRGYTLYNDSVQVHFDPGARSPGDGRAGSYVAADNGRRFEIASWPGGDPF